MTWPVDDEGYLIPGWPTDAKGALLPVDDAWLAPHREWIRQTRKALQDFPRNEMSTTSTLDTGTSEAEALRTLGSRAIKCPRWQWTAGMLTLSAGGIAVGRVIGVDDPLAPNPYEVDLMMETEGNRLYYLDRIPPFLPDFSDPATLGCLLSLVRKAWDAPTAWAQKYGSVWVVTIAVGGLVRCRAEAATEAGALVTALENAYAHA